MEINIASGPIGVFAYDQNQNLIDYEFFPKDIKKTANILYNNCLMAEKRLLSRLYDKEAKFFTENTNEFSKLKEVYPNLALKSPNDAGEIVRSNLFNISEELNFFKNKEETIDFIRSVEIELSRMKASSSISKDKIVAQTVAAIENIDKISNLIYERLQEWYSLHFPELEQLVPGYIEYSKIISQFGTRSNLVKNKDKLNHSKSKEILKKAKISLGSNLESLDLEMIQLYAKKILDLNELKEKYNVYVQDLMGEVAPNLVDLLGPNIGAKMIESAGSLKKLATFPSSTVQVIGAEKALFRHLKKGKKSPKHGTIFQDPKINTAPRWVRGKIARVLAGKISIAARMDAFSTNLISDELKLDLDEKINQILKKYPNPPKKEKNQSFKKKKRGKKRGRKNK